MGQLRLIVNNFVKATPVFVVMLRLGQVPGAHYDNR
jgi:hypothetical protein